MKLNELRANVFELSKGIFAELQAVDAQFLAGTDSGGGIPFMIPGFALHDELRVMQENGLTPFQALQTATTNAAAAMQRSDEYGTIEPGKRADLLLVSANPLESVGHLNQIDGVAAGGVWLDRTTLDQILDGISDIYQLKPDENLEQMPTLAEVDALIERMIALRSDGFVFRDFDLGEISRLLRKAGLNDRAALVRSLKLR